MAGFKASRSVLTLQLRATDDEALYLNNSVSDSYRPFPNRRITSHPLPLPNYTNALSPMDANFYPLFSQCPVRYQEISFYSTLTRQIGPAPKWPDKDVPSFSLGTKSTRRVDSRHHRGSTNGPSPMGGSPCTSQAVVSPS